MITNAFETIIDKVLIVKDKQIDMIVGSFYRNFLFWAFVVVGGLLGIFGKITVFLPWEIVLAGVVHPITSLIYHWFLMHYEMTRFRAITYAIPFSFLFIDWFFFHIHYSVLQILGVCLLVAGALIISFDFSKKSKFVFSAKAWLLILWTMLISIYRIFIFKKFNIEGLNEVSFYFNIFLVVMVMFLLIMLVKKKYHLLIPVARENQFFLKTTVSKGFDFFSGIFWLKALALGSPALVTAMDSFSPMVMLVIMFIGVKVFKMNMEEDFSRKASFIKLISFILLCFGGVLVVK